MTPTILISLFNNKTKTEFLESDKTHLGNSHKIHTFKKDDIVILLDIESKCLFGITSLDLYKSGKVYQEHHFLDSDMYSGDKSHYNKYEIKIQKVFEVIIPFEELSILCGKSLEDKTFTNIWKGSQFNFRSVQYKGDDSQSVIYKLGLLLKMAMTVKSN